MAALLKLRLNQLPNPFLIGVELNRMNGGRVRR